MSIESVMPSNHLILCCPLLLLPSIFPNIRVFSSELALCIRYQSIGVSASASVLPMSIQGWFPLRLTGLISLLSKELSGVFSSTTVRRHQFFEFCLLYGPALTIVLDHWEDHRLDCMTFVHRVTSLLFNTLSRFVIAFLQRSKCHLISWLQSPSAEILETKIINSITVSIVSPSICHEVMGHDAMIFFFFNAEF